MRPEKHCCHNKFSRWIPQHRKYAFFYVKTLVADIDLADESDHFVEDPATFIDRHIYIDFFFADDKPCMYAEIFRVQIRKTSS